MTALQQLTLLTSGFLTLFLAAWSASLGKKRLPNERKKNTGGVEHKREIVCISRSSLYRAIWGGFLIGAWGDANIFGGVRISDAGNIVDG